MTKFLFRYQGEAPERLDRILESHIQQSGMEGPPTRSQIKLLIEAKCVSVNGKFAEKAGLPVKPGAEISAELLEAEADNLAAYEVPLHVLYEDDQLIVINKPAGLSMHPGAGNKTKTLVNALVHHFGKGAPELFRRGARPGIVHRLDRDTTGVVVVAKTVSAHAVLAEQFARRSIGREYRALVFRTPRSLRPINTADDGKIEGNIGRDPHHRKRMAVVQSGGKPAVTHWHVIERLQHGCLVQVRLETGRTHQIRVHMDHIGAPVIGDLTYGTFEGLPVRLRIAAQKFGRQALHAAKLSFLHPVDARKLSFEAPLPEDFQKLLRVFRSEGEA